MIAALAEPIATRAHALALDTSLASERRRAALSLLSAAIAAGRVACAAEAGAQLGSASLPFNLSIQALASSACSPSADMLHRDAALSCLRNAAGEDGHGRAPIVAAALLKAARDSESFAAAFNMGALQQRVCVAAVAARVVQSRASAKASDAVTSLSQAVRQGRQHDAEPAPNTQFVSDVLAGLYQATADARSVSKTSQAGSTAEQWSVLAQSAEEGLVALLAACDVVNHTEAAIVALMPEDADSARSSLQRAAALYTRPTLPSQQSGMGGKGGLTGADRHVADPASDAAAAPCVWDQGRADGRGGVRIQAASSRVLQTMCEDDEWERPQEWLDMCRALIEERPDAAGIVRLMLAHPTENTLSTLNSIGEVLGESVWRGVVLPFVRTRLRLMGESVSGSQFEQDAVLLLREATRVWFTNDDPTKRPSPAFESSMWHSMLLAMKHGYSETERFPEIASRFLRHRAGTVGAGDSAESAHGLLRDWVLAAVSPQIVGHSHKMYRSISEVIFVALGMESSAFGTEEAVSVVDIPEEAVATILTTLATADTPGARFIWHELCFSYSGFLMAHKGALALLLQSISRKVNAAVTQRLEQAGLALQPAAALPVSKSAAGAVIEHQHMTDVDLQATLDLLAELALVVAPSHALMVLGTALKIMSLLPAAVESAHLGQDGKRAQTIKTGDAAVDEGASLRAGSGYATDESLAAVIEKIPSAQSLPRGMVEEALTLCGVQARSALGRLVPTPCLADASPLVRKSALQALAAGRGSIRDALRTAQTQVRVMQSVRPDSPDADLGLWAVAELAAVLPFPASLASLQAMRNNDNIQTADSSGAYAAAETATATGAGAVAFREEDGASSAAGTHTITATVAPVTDLKTYDLHLLLAAAPVLAATAVAASHDVVDVASPSMSQAVAVVSAALGRLLRGARLSVEATELSDPHPDFIRALSQIASSVPGCVLQEYALSPAGCSRVGALAQMAPEWHSLLHSWTATGVLRRRLMGGHAPNQRSGVSMVPSQATFMALDEQWVSPAARYALGLPPVGTTPATLQNANQSTAPSAPPVDREDDPVESSELLHGSSFSSVHGSEPTSVATGRTGIAELETLFLEAVHREQWLHAVRVAGQLLRSPPNKHRAVRERVQEKLRAAVLPAIKAQQLPVPDAAGGFAASDIERYDELQGLRNELMGELGVGIVQESLGMNQILEDMERAAVVQLATAGRTKQAREWMLAHGVRNPSLSLYVDALERQAANAKQGTSQLYPNPTEGAAPRGAMLSAGGGVDLLGGYDESPIVKDSEATGSEQVWVQLSSLRSKPAGAPAQTASAPPAPHAAAAKEPTASAATAPEGHMAAKESADASFDLFAQLPDTPLHRVAHNPLPSRGAHAAAGGESQPTLASLK